MKYITFFALLLTSTTSSLGMHTTTSTQQIMEVHSIENNNERALYRFAHSGIIHPPIGLQSNTLPLETNSFSYEQEKETTPNVDGVLLLATVSSEMSDLLSDQIPPTTLSRREPRCPAPQCKKKYTYWRRIGIHIQTQHPHLWEKYKHQFPEDKKHLAKKKYCIECQKSFFSIKEHKKTVRHQTRAGSPIKKSKCPLCHHFYSPAYIKQHIYIHCKKNQNADYTIGN